MTQKTLLYESYSPVDITTEQKDRAVEAVETTLILIMEQDGFILDNEYTRPVIKEKVFDILDKKLNITQIEGGIENRILKIWILEKLNEIIDYVFYYNDADGGFKNNYFRQQVRHNYKHDDIGTAFIVYSYEFITQIIIPEWRRLDKTKSRARMFTNLADLLEPLTNLKECIYYYVKHIVWDKDFRKETKILWAGGIDNYDVEITYNIFGKDMVFGLELKEEDAFKSIDEVRKAIYSHHCTSISWNGHKFDKYQTYEYNFDDAQEFIYNAVNDYE